MEYVLKAEAILLENIKKTNSKLETIQLPYIN